MKSLYLRRSARFHLMNERYSIIDRNRPRMVTMDQPYELVFELATGHRTVGEIAALLESRGIANAIGIVDELVALGFVELSSDERPLPFYLELPIGSYDLAEASAAMLRDGFVKKPR